MAKIVSINEAKTHLSRLIDEVAAGAEIILAKAGKPTARLSPINSRVKKKNLGLLRGKIKVADNFNMPVDNDVLAQIVSRCSGRTE